jgi:uncharacterized protein YecT (DUF1311 family)
MKVWVMIAAALLAAPALAQDLDCNHAMAQPDMNSCADKDFQAADKKLNKLYTNLMSKYEPKYQALLKDAERKWIAYRDAECAFETAQSEGGSINPMEYSLCLREKTNARIKELKAQRDCPEGDLTCNNP